ncbi:hypothetical protein [Rosenbergiella collisarenosi]|uniref:hypothetical protein n=1 Tax=Rosenbergiella collisarenosi TaxID=1544695 RepID=UPI001F4F02B0|nr:hypothetical protein [Rosenbergiella collisarenosi]
MFGKVKDLIKDLQKYHDQDEYLLMPVWGVCDVQALNSSLSDENLIEVLRNAHRNHDAEIGINHDILRFHLEQLSE